MSDLLPSTQRFVERMRRSQRGYPADVHQLLFVERLDEWQRRAPCATDHEHGSGCYSAQILVEVNQWQRDGSKR